MENKIAIVTGGSRGIGRAICHELASKNIHVLINYKSNKEAANLVEEEIKKMGYSAETIAFDVSSFEETAKAIEDWKLKNLGKKISILVNNAGIINDSVFLMMTKDNWNNVINTSLGGFYNVTQAVIGDMLRERFGVVVNIASVAGLTGIAGQANYAAAKAGLIGVTKSLAVEFAKRNVRVNAVAPGFITTDMTSPLNQAQLKNTIPMNRFGNPEEVAKCVGFLVSNDSSYITGEVISVNGGMHT